MAKTLEKSKKRKSSISKPNKIEKKLKTKTTSTPYSSSSSSSGDSSSDSESPEKDFDAEELRDLLQPYSKDQLVDLVCSAAKIGSSIYSAVVEAADRDVTHRKIFVYGLPWETTRETLFEVFESYGEIEECTVVIDKATGKAKGFGFVMFKSRKGAREALMEPRKRILNRTATCQLASMGPAGTSKGQDQTGPVKISFGSQVQTQQLQTQGQQQQHVFAGAASPFMLGNQYHPVYGTGMLGNPGLVGGGGGYMYPMLASAMAAHGGLLQASQMGGIVGEQGSYFGGQSLPHNGYNDSDKGKSKDSDGGGGGGGGGSFHGYSNYSS
ncbi:unnamed protein product [Cochlearia groenlandica]